MLEFKSAARRGTESRARFGASLRMRSSRMASRPSQPPDAGRDHYNHDSADQLTAIEAQLGDRPLLGLLPWHPLEVSELERWTTPRCEGEHLKRLLACTILLRNVGYVPDPSETFFVQESASTLLRLADSAIALEQPRTRKDEASAQTQSVRRCLAHRTSLLALGSWQTAPSGISPVRIFLHISTRCAR